ncbi:MAG: selenoneine biosynthesis selenosugar synthase SenB [Planctomycetota bacterium]
MTPAARGARSGNRVTALRWALLLRQLGHRPFVAERWDGRPAAALLALHARKSAPSVRAWVERHGSRATAVLLAGTDIYPRFDLDADLLACLCAAHVLVALQPEALDLLPPELRAKTRVVLQSARATWAERPKDTLQACVLANLRAVKDPLLPFRAAALVPPALSLQVKLAGQPLDPDLEAAAAATDARDRRCRWLGPLSRRRALALLAQSHVCIVPSLGEGGANVVSEAIAAGSPVLASAIPGNTGILGQDWPGLFPPGDAAALAALLTRLCAEPAFLADLRRRTQRLLPLVEPRAERAALQALLADLGVAAARPAGDDLDGA